MSGNVGVKMPLRRLTPGRGQYFFGYYDIPAADTLGRHLCHYVKFRDRIPKPDDTAVLGWIPLPGSAGDKGGDLPFVPFAETTAWNFQQGAMLQWLPALPDTCIYNVFENGSFGTCLHNVRTNKRRILPLPVMNVSADGSKALSGNMSRQFDFRPGYGYAGIPDPFAGVNAPEKDGVFLMDLATGKYKLILSLAEIVSFLAKAGEKMEDWKVMINCMTFNPSANRFILFLRNFPRSSNPGGSKWYTFIPTADLSGGNLRNHRVWGIASHYHWRDDENLVIWTKAEAGDKLDLIMLNDRTGERQFIDRSFFLHDGHCSFSKDLQYILYDSYPDPKPPDHFRKLLVYDLKRRQGIDLGRFRSDPAHKDVDIRCDLHPRWMPGCRAITFDSIHEGYRGIYWMDLAGII